MGLLLLMSAGAVRAQKNFQPGYVVRPARDTLRGEVDVRGAQRMQHQCSFRAVPAGPVTNYSPAELQGYGVQNAASYESGQLLPAARGNPDTPAEPLFLQVLATGRATLYTFADESQRVRYGFRQAPGPATELVRRTRLVTTNGTTVQEELYPFRQVLSLAFADCPAVQARLATVELSDAQLTALFARYNTCGAAPAGSVTTAARRSTFRLGFVAGVQTAQATLNDGKPVTLHSTGRPVFGVGLLLAPATFNPKLALRLEALFQSQRLEADYQGIYSTVANLPGYYTAVVQVSSLRLPLLLRYTWPTGKLRPYIQAGSELAVMLRREAMVRSSNVQLNGTRAVSSTDIRLRSGGFGFAAGAGLLVPLGAAGALQLEARFSQLDNASVAKDLLTGATTTSLLLGYNVGR